MLARERGSAVQPPVETPGFGQSFERIAARLRSNVRPAGEPSTHDRDVLEGPAIEPGESISPSAQWWSGIRQVFRLVYFVKYLGIGSVACALDVGLFLILHNVGGFPPLLAHSISVPIAVLFSFTCNAVLNFGTTDYIPLRFLSFVAVACVGYLAGAAILSIRDLLGVDANLAKALSLPLVFALQYSLNSLISFRKVSPSAS